MVFLRCVSVVGMIDKDLDYAFNNKFMCNCPIERGGGGRPFNRINSLLSNHKVDLCHPFRGCKRLAIQCRLRVRKRHVL